MRYLLLIGLLIVALFAGFAALNWPLIAAAVPLNFGGYTVTASLGFTMSAFLAAIILVLATQMALQQLSITRVRRQQAKALDAQRALAEQAEASRFSELRATLLSEFERMSATVTASQDALRLEIQESANSIAAMLGEMDDRLTASPSSQGSALRQLPGE
jgi:hypothetical protein